jgi:hypothetical protein
MAKFHYLDDVPDFYIAHAAREFASDRPNAAKAWIDSASRIYGEAALFPLQGLFVDVGWLQFPRTNALRVLQSGRIASQADTTNPMIH